MCILTLIAWLSMAFAKAPEAAWEPPADLVDDYNRALEAFDAGNPEKALAIATRVVAKAPDCGMALLVLGQLRLRLNQPEEATEVLRHAVALFPDQGPAHLLLSHAAFGAQDFALASEASGRALTLTPSDPSAATLAVLASLRLGDVAEARARVGRATLPAPDIACLDVQILLEAGDLDGAKNRLAACDATADPNLHMNARSSMAGHTNDVDAAAELAEPMGITGYALAERGRKLLEAGRCAEAIPLLDAASIAHPKEVALRVNRARCLVTLGRLEEAEEALVVVLASDTWVDTHVSGAMSGIMSKTQEERLHDLQREAAIELVGVQASRSRTKEAHATLAAARARHGEVIQILIAEATLARTEGRGAESWRLLRAAMIAFPAEPALAAVLALGPESGGAGLDAAVVAYVRAHGTLVDRHNLAILEYQGKDWAGCAEDYAAAAAGDPTGKAAGFAYACAVFGGDVDRAFALLGPLGEAAPRANVHDHALRLQDAGRHVDALSLLKLYPTADVELEAAMRRLAVTSHLELGQFDEAVALAAKPGLPPRFLAWVGQELLAADRKSDAARILGGVCGELEGEDAKWCAALVERAGRP